MGNPEADSSSEYQGDHDHHPQVEEEFEVQAHEYQQQVPEPTFTSTGDGVSPSNYDHNQQDQYQQQPQPLNTTLQVQINYEPQPQPQGGQQPFQQQPFRPQPNIYQQPQQPRPPPAQFPPQSPQQYPPKSPQQYPPQPQQGYQQPQVTPPAQFPPQPQINPNPIYNGSNQPAGAYPPQPQKFPPASPSTPQHQIHYQQQQPQQPQQEYATVQAKGSPYAAQGVPVQPNPYQPGPHNHINMQNMGTEAWSTELFDCMDDPMNAVITAFVPCLTFGQIAEVVDKGTTSCTTSGLFYGLIAGLIGVPFIMSCTYRTKLRSMFGLIESPAPDWVTHFFCEPCALCQEYRELQIRGLDPSIGWIGNVARNPSLQQQQPVVMMVPPAYQNMNPNMTPNMNQNMNYNMNNRI